MSRLIPVVVKRTRVREQVVAEDSVLNFHSYKIHGGVLNPNANGGRGYYTRRLKGQDLKRVMNQLQDIADGKQEAV